MKSHKDPSFPVVEASGLDADAGTANHRENNNAEFSMGVAAGSMWGEGKVKEVLT
jgi:hypothetical protein